MISIHNKTALAILALAVVLAGSYLILSAGKFILSTPGQIGCTMEAKLCPDGSAVGRSGPSCEFAPCPLSAGAGNIPLKTFTDEIVGITFSYPGELPTKYISTVDWPPKVEFLNEFFACNVSGTETTPEGRREKRTVNGRQYCRTTVSEGAAGSVYNQYTYAFADNDNTLILSFTLRFVQCGNYDGAEKSACESERASFDVDIIVDSIAQSVKF